MTIGNDLYGYAAVALFAIVAHESWRWLGAFLGSKVRETDDIFVWVRYVSSALVAALAMRFVFFPAGVLETVAFPVRCAAMAIGIAAFIACRRNLAIGILAGGLSLIALTYAVRMM
jgi:branched-subunit amino acid transport protein